MIAVEPTRTADPLLAYMAECRELALEELATIIPREDALGPVLYDLMREYPLRPAKALRPALCIATSRALGGSLHAVLRSAAVIELYHNAFLIHDDVEDQSQKRRELPTLHLQYNVPIAVNVGDAMLALALEPLIDNTQLLGLGKALRILRIVARMARESAEGQAMELAWTRAATWDLTDADYLRMVHKKTGWYTFLAPVLVGATVGEAGARMLAGLKAFAISLGAAFQIQDDILNLVADERRYGKEIDGDLWEGKQTLMLLHAIRNATPAERERARDVLSKRRPRSSDARDPVEAVEALLSKLGQDGELSARAERDVLAAVRALRADQPRYKTSEDVAFLSELIRRQRSVEHAARLAERRARRARRTLTELGSGLTPSVHLEFLHGLVDFVTQRDR